MLQDFAVIKNLPFILTRIFVRFRLGGRIWSWQSTQMQPHFCCFFLLCTSISFSDVRVFRIFHFENCPSNIFCPRSQCWKSSRNETYPLWFKRFALFFSFVTSHWFNPLANNLWFRGSFGARDSVKDGKAQHLDVCVCARFFCWGETKSHIWDTWKYHICTHTHAYIYNHIWYMMIYIMYVYTNMWFITLYPAS